MANASAQIAASAAGSPDETVREAYAADRDETIPATKLDLLFDQIRAALERNDVAGAVLVVDLLRESLRNVDRGGSAESVSVWTRLMADDD